jgi:DNA adenine methylase
MAKSSEKPLFIWAGGKNKMLKKYAPLLPQTFDRYIEPFFGGGAMFIWAYKKNPKAQFIINDYNKDIVSIYQAVKNDCTKFKKYVDELEAEYIPLEKGKTNKELEKKYSIRTQCPDDPTKSHLNKDWSVIYEIEPTRRHFYFKVRHENAFAFEGWTETKKAAVLYFLMKTGFNGIWQINKNTNNRFGTPFGLGNQKDKIYNRKDLDWWNQALQNTTIISSDFEPVVYDHVTRDSFVFMDPPYRDSFTQYETDFNDDEQERVIKCLTHCEKIGAYGLLSNRDSNDGFFEERWRPDDIHYFDVTYTAGRRKKTEDGFKAKAAREVLLVTK